MPGCPWCLGVLGAWVPLVPGCPWCPGVLGARVSLVPGCPWCLGALGARVSLVPGCPWCPWCPGVLGAWGVAISGMASRAIVGEAEARNSTTTGEGSSPVNLTLE